MRCFQRSDNSHVNINPSKYQDFTIPKNKTEKKVAKGNGQTAKFWFPSILTSVSLCWGSFPHRQDIRYMLRIEKHMVRPRTKYIIPSFKKSIPFHPLCSGETQFKRPVSHDPQVTRTENENRMWIQRTFSWCNSLNCSWFNSPKLGFYTLGRTSSQTAYALNMKPWFSVLKCSYSARFLFWAGVGKGMTCTNLPSSTLAFNDPTSPNRNATASTFLQIQRANHNTHCFERTHLLFWKRKRHKGKNNNKDETLSCSQHLYWNMRTVNEWHILSGQRPTPSQSVCPKTADQRQDWAETLRSCNSLVTFCCQLSGWVQAIQQQR